jgi:hypothetical protein
MTKSILTILVIAGGLLVSSCKKKDSPSPSNTNNGGGNSTTTITAPYYWQASIDGSDKTFQYGVNGYTNGGGSSNIDGTSSSTSNQYSSIFGKYGLSNGNVTLANDFAFFEFNFPNDDPTQTDYNNYFAVGSKNYFASETDYNGVGIVWNDPSGTTWSTFGGSQSGSTFNISAVSSSTVNYQPVTILTGTFNCKLYNGSSSKTVTNGKFKAIVLAYN